MELKRINRIIIKYLYEYNKKLYKIKDKDLFRRTSYKKWAANELYRLINSHLSEVCSRDDIDSLILGFMDMVDGYAFIDSRSLRFDMAYDVSNLILDEFLML